MKCVKLMQVVEIVFAITSPEDIDLGVVRVSCMHIARTRWHSFDV
jgi:hypothetical protein